METFLMIFAFSIINIILAVCIDKYYFKLKIRKRIEQLNDLKDDPKSIYPDRIKNIKIRINELENLL
jgi:septation ring formation regulator EzrA